MPDVMQWLDALSEALDERQKKVDEYRAWYEGNHPLPEPPVNTFAAHDAEARTAFRNMARLGVTNLMAPVVDSPASKLRIEGFRFGESPVSSDAEAWTIWERNNLTGDSDLSTHGALETGQAFAVVWADAQGLATITVEDPAECIVAYQTGSRRVRAAGLKRWVADDGHLNATLYLTDAIYKFRSKQKANSTLYVPARPGETKWLIREVPGEEWPLKNPTGKVSLHEIRANPQLKHSRYGGGRPEFLGQLNEQRKLNLTVLQMLITMEHQAFRQRWVTGWGVPTNANGEPDRNLLLKASAAALSVFNNDQAGPDDQDIRVGEFAQADFNPFRMAIQEWVKVIASTSATPPYAFLLGDMVNVAADSLARIEAQHTNKIEAHGRALGVDYTEIILDALAIEGNEKANDPSAAVIWCEPESRTATEQANLAQIMNNLGAPKQAVFSALPGVTQQEAARWIADGNAARLLDSALGLGEPEPAP